MAKDHMTPFIRNVHENRKDLRGRAGLGVQGRRRERASGSADSS
jgi:hypothetical protein